jgi:hypothetical protein
VALPIALKLWHGGSDSPPEVHEPWSGVGQERRRADVSCQGKADVSRPTLHSMLALARVLRPCVGRDRFDNCQRPFS